MILKNIENNPHFGQRSHKSVFNCYNDFNDIYVKNKSIDSSTIKKLLMYLHMGVGGPGPHLYGKKSRKCIFSDLKLN